MTPVIINFLEFYFLTSSPFHSSTNIVSTFHKYSYSCFFSHLHTLSASHVQVLQSLSFPNFSCVHWLWMPQIDSQNVRETLKVCASLGNSQVCIVKIFLSMPSIALSRYLFISSLQISFHFFFYIINLKGGKEDETKGVGEGVNGAVLREEGVEGALGMVRRFMSGRVQ